MVGRKRAVAPVRHRGWPLRRHRHQMPRPSDAQAFRTTPWSSTIRIFMTRGYCPVAVLRQVVCADRFRRATARATVRSVVTASVPPMRCRRSRIPSRPKPPRLTSRSPAPFVVINDDHAGVELVHGQRYARRFRPWRTALLVPSHEDAIGGLVDPAAQAFDVAIDVEGDCRVARMPERGELFCGMRQAEVEHHARA